MMMRRLFRFGAFLVLAFSIWSTPPALAGEVVSGEDAARIRSVIGKQLDALKRDDWAEAFSYAAPFLQQKFGTPDTFRRMVMGGYAIVHRPRAVSFKALEEIQGRLAQSVFMVGPDGKSAMVVYFMRKISEGVWRIGGVSIIPLADQTA
jgi:hypothetical protein